MPRKNSDNGDNDGDVEMDNKEAVKTVTIKKRKEVGDKKKRYIILFSGKVSNVKSLIVFWFTTVAALLYLYH